MYTELRKKVNAHFDSSAEKFAQDIETLTNKTVLDSWYYRDRLTAAAMEEVKNSDPGAVISETVKKKMLKRFNTENEKTREKYLHRLTAAEATKAPDVVTITVQWYKNRTWGYNPTAEVIAERTRTTDSASGCGYDKQSAAIAGAFNANPEIMAILYDHAEKGGNFAYSVHTFAGIPYFDGGCGVSCFYSVFAGCGYEFIDVTHGETLDVYQLRKKEV